MWGWRNNPYKPEWGHYGCKDYEENNWCAQHQLDANWVHKIGGPTYGNGHGGGNKLGARLNYPERNCCACGKGKRQGKSKEYIICITYQ